MGTDLQEGTEPMEAEENGRCEGRVIGNLISDRLSPEFGWCAFESGGVAGGPVQMTASEAGGISKLQNPGIDAVPVHAGRKREGRSANSEDRQFALGQNQDQPRSSS